MAQAAPIERATFSDALSGMLNVFVDPAVTARQAVKKGFWIWPVLIMCIVVALYSWLLAPLMVQVMQNNPPSNMSHEQFERSFPVMRTMVYASSVIAPVFLVLIVLLSSWLVNLACTVLGIQTKFRDVFSLVAACGLIGLLQVIAGYIVVRLKAGDLQSMEEFQPPFGLDIFFNGLKGPLLAILNFFSVFQIWYIVMLGLGLAFMTRAKKSTAFIAITPAWLVPLLFKILGSLFQRG